MIQFPKIHIATSVLNRIQNSMEDMGEAFPELQTAPTLPGANSPALGQLIEEEATPTEAPVEAPEDPDAAAVVAEGMAGGSPFTGLLGGALG